MQLLLRRNSGVREGGKSCVKCGTKIPLGVALVRCSHLPVVAISLPQYHIIIFPPYVVHLHYKMCVPSSEFVLFMLFKYIIQHKSFTVAVIFFCHSSSRPEEINKGEGI